MNQILAIPLSRSAMIRELIATDRLIRKIDRVRKVLIPMIISGVALTAYFSKTLISCYDRKPFLANGDRSEGCDVSPMAVFSSIVSTVVLVCADCLVRAIRSDAIQSIENSNN